MIRIKFSFCLLLLLSTAWIQAMVDPNEDQDQQEQSTQPRGQIIFYSSMEEMKSIYANIFRPEGATPEAADAASTCNLEKLKQHVDSINVNVIHREKQTSLLSLALTKQVQQKPFDSTVPDYLISLGAFTDKRVTSTQPASPLMIAASWAIFQGRFTPVEYLLQKGANPFLTHQIHTGWSAAGATVQCKDDCRASAQTSANRERLVSLFAARARTIHEALEIYDLPTIRKFADPQSTNTPDAQGCTPLLKVLGCSCPHLNTQAETITILRLLLEQKANPNQVGIWERFRTAPLDLATGKALESHDTSLVQLFLEAGANPKLDTNPENKLETVRCAYDIATHFKSAADECPCGKEDCKSNYPARRAVASKLLKLFDAHLAQRTT